MSNPTELPELDKLRKIGNLIMTQDNRITDQPMFIVQQRRRMYGLDTGYCENFIWLCSEDEYNEASADEADALEAEYQDTGRAKDGWQRTGYMDQWEFVTACFTEQGCIDYLKLDGHNLNEPRIYAEGSYRNEEFRAVRNSLIALARRAQPEGEAPQAEPFLYTRPFDVENAGLSPFVLVARKPTEEFDIPLYTGNPAATLSPLCGAQHAESGALDWPHAPGRDGAQDAPSAPGTPEAPAVGKSLLRPAISATNPLPPGCYCKPGKCAAPVVMGRQTPCRDPAKRAAQLDGGQEGSGSCE